jgi:hypothetical protein
MLDVGDVSAQEAFSAEQPTMKYLEIGVGVNGGKFRDFATSPLFYESDAFSFEINHLKTSHRRESRSDLTLIAGRYLGRIGEGTAGSATAYTIGYNWVELYQIERFSNEAWNVKAGGTLSSLLNVRLNPSFMNNQFGLEAFFNLMGSAKVSRDISRTESKSGKIWFIKYNLKPRVRKLSYQLNVGFLNSNVRRGYIYTSHEAIVNDDTALDESYEFRVNGFRLSADLDYTHYFRDNKNALTVGYSYDIFTTGGEKDKFEMVTKVLKFTLLVNL